MTIDPLLAYGWPGLVLLVWIALSVGSFLNVVIHRFPLMLKRDWNEQAREVLELPPPDDAAPYNLLRPRSACPKCGRAIGAIENVPVASWLVLGGKCKGCKAPIAARYPAVEVLTALMTVAVVHTFGFTTLGLAACLFTWVAIAATFIDFDTQLLPDQLTLPLLWLGLAVNVGGGFALLHDAVVGAIAGYLFLWLTYWGFKLATGKDGMGYGDFKLFAALGAWFGWQALPAIILIASIAGIAYAIVGMALKRKKEGQPIAFGPFLATAGWIALIGGDAVIGRFSLI